MRRVVVTGMGMISPLACGVDATWRRLIAGESGVAAIHGFETTDLSARIAAQVPRGEEPDAFDPDAYIARKEQRKMDPFIHYAIAAATQAVEQSRWTPESAALSPAARTRSLRNTTPT